MVGDGRARAAGLVAVTAGAVLAAAAAVEHHLVTLATNNDGFWYIRMRGRLSPCQRAPFCWRVGVPLLSRVIPATPTVAFAFITFASVIATTIVLWVLLADEVGPRMAWLGPLLFLSLPFVVKFGVVYPWLTDPVLVLLASVVLLALRGGRFGVAAVLIVAGVLVKEESLILVALYYGITASEVWDRRRAKEAAGIALVGVAVLAVLHFVMPAHNDVIGEAVRFGRSKIRGLDAQSARQFLLDPWGVLIPAAVAIGWRTDRELVIRATPFMVAVYAQTFVAYDTGRLLMLGGPAIVWLAARSLAALNNGTRTLWAAGLVLVAATASRSPVDFGTVGLWTGAIAFVVTAATADRSGGVDLDGQWSKRRAAVERQRS